MKAAPTTKTLKRTKGAGHQFKEQTDQFDFAVLKKKHCFILNYKITKRIRIKYLIL
jgi:hypothetical protein